MLLLGAFGVSELLERGLDEASVTWVRGRTLRGYEEAPRKTRGDPRVFIMAAPVGLGLLLFGVWQMKRQGQLLIEGVAVVGYLSDEEVTVVYDPQDPRKHLLDLDEVRRADARGRRLAGRRS